MTNQLTPPASAAWIGSDHPFDLHEVYLNFRSPLIDLPTPPQEAQLFVTADSRYRLWINGEFQARGPARSWPHAQSVDQIDVSAHLRAGQNVIAVQVYQPGYSHFSYLHRAAAGLLAWLVLDGETILVTDAAWRVRRDPSFAADVPRVSIYGSGVEVHHQPQQEEWVDVAAPADKFAPARIVAPPRGYPWTDLQPRQLPMLVERTYLLGEDSPQRRTERRKGELKEFRRGVTMAALDLHDALRLGWHTATPAEPTCDADGFFTLDLNPNESAYWLYDLGHDITCQGWAEIRNGYGVESLSIGYQEKIRNGELVISDPSTYCRVRLTDHFGLRPGDQIAESFALRGGRYLIFHVTGPTQGLQLRFHVRSAAYPLEVNHVLHTGDAELDAIVELCERTFHACLQETFVDCVWRESSQWLGDALPQALILTSMSDDLRPLRTVIEMAAQGAYPDGVLPGVMPGEVHAYTVVDYNFTWIELLKLYFERSADADFVAAHWPVLTRVLDRFHADVTADGLIRSQTGRRLFLDWSPQSRKEPSAVYNFRYLWGMQQAVSLAETWGSAEDGFIEAKRRRCDELKQAIREHFLQDEIWWDDLARTTFSQLAASFAVLTGAATAAERAAVLDAVVARSLNPDDNPADGRMVLAGPFMHHYVFEALHHAARRQDVIDIIRLRWGRWVRNGYPTTWENWNVDFPDGSQCHAFSAHPRYHLERVIGYK
jgi:hypothetical protein